MKKKLLKILKDKGHKIDKRDLYKILIHKYEIDAEIQGQINITSSKAYHIIDCLADEGLIIKKKGQSGRGRFGEFVGITKKGENYLNPVKRLWNFFTDEMAKIVSVGAMALAILGVLGFEFDVPKWLSEQNIDHQEKSLNMDVVDQIIAEDIIIETEHEKQYEPKF